MTTWRDRRGGWSPTLFILINPAMREGYGTRMREELIELMLSRQQAIIPGIADTSSTPAHL
ncbi:hypothetical protein [Allohahella marinimesophila]|uniref:hypothetical protein n=1 Tax=Allohahella marinimesophila TaxID=1054972 RepID=UPI0031D0F700